MVERFRSREEYERWKAERSQGEASRSQPTSKTWRQKIAALALVLVAFGAFFYAAGRSKETEQERISKFTDDVALFISRYGVPDVDDSTQYDRPRPPIVTRWLIYQKEDVRLNYIPKNITIGTPPPYKDWRLIGATDAKGTRTLSADELVSRMKHRKRW